jgi:putative NADH-flavin reductase
MHIAVIGANGRSGQVFVARALEGGHTVRAGVRGESRLPAHPNLTVQECDATNIPQIEQLTQECDAVVTLIGHIKNSPPTVQTEAMQKLVQAMQRNNKTRLVSLTGTGVRFPRDVITLIDRFLNIGVSLIDPNRVRDGITASDVLRKSDLDWTLIRVLKLTEGKPSDFHLKEHGPAKSFVSRTEVAQAILQVLEDGAWLRAAPIVGLAR